jgi:MoxR-like ATPase
MTGTTTPPELSSTDTGVLRQAVDEVGRRIVGQTGMIERLLIGLLTGGHILLEGVPGLAKTLAVRTLADILSVSFSRIQFTPDLLPADVVGTMVFDPKTQEFHPKHGPLFANIVLADEINRAPAKVQSALLEAMQEHQVTIGGRTFHLPEPFLVLATQNPIESEGTYPLPEAQLDRFLMRFSLGYPTLDEELQMLQMLQHEHPVDAIQPVVTAEELIACQRAIRQIHVDPKVRTYLAQIVHDTRDREELSLGASPRATIALFRAGQALAAIRGRGFVQPDDVKRVAASVLTHRVILRPEARLRKVTAAAVVEDVIADVAVPMLSHESQV